MCNINSTETNATSFDTQENYLLKSIRFALSGDGEPDGALRHWMEVGDGLFELAEGFFDCLRDDADVADNRHEVDVAIPARNDVGVDVAGDAGAGDLADVDADVEALRIHGAIEGALTEDEEFHHLSALFGRTFD